MRKLEEIWMKEKDMEKWEQAMTKPLTDGNGNEELYRVL
jgi:hypothetical protein